MAEDIRKTLLEVIAEQRGSLQAVSILREASQRLGIRGNDSAKDQALLTYWYDLFRTGYLSWGFNLANPDPPWFHLTDRGRETLKNLSRDPSNPAGYFAHIEKAVKLDPVARSYLVEGLKTYNNECMKATAVMVGAAAERLTLQLRDVLVGCLKAKGTKIPAALADWQVKRVRDALAKEFDAHKKDMPKELADRYSAYWLGFTEQARRVRNDAGHPENIDPVTPEDVYAALLIFPEQAKLVADLEAWVKAHYA